MTGVSHVLVLSLGNPAPYLNTLHSAGHVALEALRRELMLPAFAGSRRLGGRSAPTTTGVDDMRQYTLMQSPTLMNVSGPWVARVWHDAVGILAPVDRLGLVLVHDELEEALGVLKTRPWTRSHRGHNGLKSVNASLQPASFPGAHWAKLSVGIGRPDGRDHATVSDYVMRPITPEQRSGLETNLGSGVLATIRQLEAAWAAADGRASRSPSPSTAPSPKRPKTRPHSRQQ